MGERLLLMYRLRYLPRCSAALMRYRGDKAIEVIYCLYNVRATHLRQQVCRSDPDAGMSSVQG